jgi:pSer/pThr/pTyr-binding forkhead associated (FHA) protein
MARLAQLVDDVVVHKFELEGEELTIGRHPNNGVVVDDVAVSGFHAVVRFMPNKDFPQFYEFYLEDLQSTNGTFVNDKRLLGKTRLHNNDIVRIAYNRFKFLDDKEADLERTVHMLQQSKF